MPRLTGEPIIRHAWRPRADRENIHYLADGGGGSLHLRAKPGEPLYDVLEDALVRAGHPKLSYPGRVRAGFGEGMPPLDPRCT